MGFRKATNNVDMQVIYRNIVCYSQLSFPDYYSDFISLFSYAQQDSQMPLLPNGNGSGETSFSGMADNFPVSVYSSLLGIFAKQVLSHACSI